MNGIRVTIPTTLRVVLVKLPMDDNYIEGGRSCDGGERGSKGKDVVAFAAVIDSAVVSNVRNDLDCEGSKTRSKSRFSATNFSVFFLSSFLFEKSLTVYIRWVQPQYLRGLRACISKKLYALQPEEIHISETKSPQKGNYVLHKVLPRETRERHSPCSGVWREERVLGQSGFSFIREEAVVELEALRPWGFWKSPTKYKIRREEPLGSLRVRSQSVGENCPKHC